jgi:AraC-like DNA-binding protein
LQQLGQPVEPILRRALLSEADLERTDAHIPATQLWSFARIAALRSGRLDLGAIAGGIMPTADYGSFGASVTRQPTLLEAVQAFCAGASAEYSKADFYLERHPGGLLFCRGPIEGDEVEMRQVELYVVAMMLRLIRDVVGREWWPRRIDLQTFDAGDLERHFDWPATRLRTDARRTAIALDDLALSRSATTATATSTQGIGVDRAVPELTEVILDLIDRDGGANVSLSSIARKIGISARSLQSLLRQHGTSYSSMIENSRLKVATRRLADPAVPLAEIALDTGYASQTQFTRAFKRWTGLTPGAYRRQLGQGGCGRGEVASVGGEDALAAALAVEAHGGADDEDVVLPTMRRSRLPDVD